MKTIYEYTDYREFLNDIYKEKKETNPAFSRSPFLSEKYRNRLLHQIFQISSKLRSHCSINDTMIA